MVLNFLDKYIRNDYEIPDAMVESNVRMDYDKLRMLIRHDKEFAHDASIIQQLVTQGYVTSKLVEPSLLLRNGDDRWNLSGNDQVRDP